LPKENIVMIIYLTMVQQTKWQHKSQTCVKKL
jgi:hypothetical protein